TMNKLAEILPAHFIRTHRTAMVRQDQIKSFKVIGDGKYQVTTQQGLEIPVSETYATSVREVLEQ
ncbi:MAG: LytTR family transcriptional regulator, partial [Acidobacteria bacterium]|nr:LytTR family transcriptional regulator [Acidobacteriota bacterium]